MIYVTGNTNGDIGRFYDGDSLTKGRLGRDDFLIVCGDFGFIYEDDLQEEQELNLMADLPFKVLFVDGHRENFDKLDQYPISSWNGGDVHHIRHESVIHLMRGQVFEIEGHKIFTMGGGYSTDRFLKEEGIEYWIEEMPTEKEYAEARHNLSGHGYKVDYIISHTSPEETREYLRPAPHKEEPFIKFLQWVDDKVDYQHWYQGQLRKEEEVWYKQTVVYEDVRELKSNQSIRRLKGN